MATKQKVSAEHGLKHEWVWVYQTEENDSYTRIIYDDNVGEANIVCGVPGCGVVVPGTEYIALVEKTRQYLHLGEDAHVSALQDMLEIIALSHESDERLDVNSLDRGDTVEK